MVIWITGLSGSGKTTLANALAGMLKPRLPNLAVLDGDAIRAAFGSSLGYTVPDRIHQIKRLQGLAQMLENQGVVTIVAVLYSTTEMLAWNRANFSRYREIYLKAPMDFLAKNRDSKSLYAHALAGKIRNVVGVDIAWEEPRNPDLVFDSAEQIAPAVLAGRVAALEPVLQNALARS